MKAWPPVTVAPSFEAQASDGQTERRTLAIPSAVPFSTRGVGCGGRGGSARACSFSRRFSSSRSAWFSTSCAPPPAFLPFAAAASRIAASRPCLWAWCASRASLAVASSAPSRFASARSQRSAAAAKALSQAVLRSPLSATTSVFSDTGPRRWPSRRTSTSPCAAPAIAASAEVATISTGWPP